ncbi:hypothetical protein PSCICM_17500 [Pseudomonas cichorii]|uniref:Uncharacterized protein n=1 Tax=Pseudomonas cichorii TaxID=36746 RepID=A0ABQ1DJ42_PSECI|nr:hypothetical protein PSCICM_17500 [Pseudomonas cichorii]GFM91014.1 hypothetical protein PSCICP_09860 [Pseudomonas cichorii]
MTEGKSCSPHHIALGATDISQDSIAKVQRRQQAKELFHGQNRDSKLNDICALTSGRQIRLTAVHNTQFNGQCAGFRVKIDPHHFTAQTAFANTFCKGAADQAQTDDHKPTDDRSSGYLREINHAQKPCG